MSRVTYAWRDGKMVEIANDEVRRLEQKAKAGVTIITDDLPAPIQSPINGKMFTSRSAYNRHVEGNGFVYKADCPKGTKPKQIKSTPEDYRQAVAEAIEMCRSGNSGLSEYERHVCKEYDRRIKNHG